MVCAGKKVRCIFWRIFVPALLVAILLLASGCLGHWRCYAAEIEPAIEFADNSQGIIAAISYKIPPDYHAYANKQGDAGRPTSLAFSLGASEPMPVLYPAGSMQRDLYDPAATVFVYDGEVRLFVLLPVSALGMRYTAKISMLLCSARHCLPYSKSISGIVPEKIPPLSQMPWQKDYAQQSRVIVGNALRSLAESEKNPPPNDGNVHVEESSGQSQPEIGQIGQEPEGKVSDADFGFALKPRYFSEDFEIYGLAKALILGLLAGLLLNSMPCVLPVLTLKVSGILLMGGINNREKQRLFREHNLFFAAGILSLFTILALLLGMADLMWGQLYQSQAILLLMLILVFLLGLSMLGVFNLPSFDIKAGSTSDKPRLHSYLTGLVSTFLATPCSGPLLGGVLGWAFTQPMLTLVAVFWAVGFGMALPYFVFALWPSLARILPRPGPWMHVFERLVGFLLLATALYLLSILPAEKHIQVLDVLLLVSFCAWLWGRYCGLSAPPLRRRVLGLVAAGILCSAVFWVLRPVGPIPQWREFNLEAFRTELGKKPMLLEFTADWCPNCKFLEATVLTDERLRSLQEEYGFELIRVDLTRPHDNATRLLAMLGSKSIPLTALFAAGPKALKPLVLRDIYGVGSLEQALAEQFGAEKKFSWSLP